MYPHGKGEGPGYHAAMAHLHGCAVVREVHQHSFAPEGLVLLGNRHHEDGAAQHSSPHPRHAAGRPPRTPPSCCCLAPAASPLRCQGAIPIPQPHAAGLITAGLPLVEAEATRRRPGQVGGGMCGQWACRRRVGCCWGRDGGTGGGAGRGAGQGMGEDGH